MTAFLKPAEVAERWGVSERQVERLCASGRLRAMKLGGWRIRLADVEAYEAAKANRPPEQPAPTTRAEPIRPVFGVLQEAGDDRVLGERWWEQETNSAASSAAGGSRAADTRKRRSAVTKRR